MKKLLPFVLFVLPFFLITSCKEKINDKQDPIFPLAVGNIWTYKQTTYNGGSPSTTTTQTEVKNKHTIDGYSGFVIQEYTEQRPISLLNNDDYGNLIEYFFDEDKFIYETAYFRKNVKRGDTWIYRVAVYSDNDSYRIDEKEIRCITTDTIIETSKGSFLCMGFLWHPGGFDNEGRPHHTMIHFLSENIGQVKYLHYEHQYGGTVLFNETVLVDYSLK